MKESRALKQMVPLEDRKLTPFWKGLFYVLVITLIAIAGCGIYFGLINPSSSIKEPWGLAPKETPIVPKPTTPAYLTHQTPAGTCEHNYIKFVMVLTNHPGLSYNQKSQCQYEVPAYYCTKCTKLVLPPESIGKIIQNK